MPGRTACVVATICPGSLTATGRNATPIT